MEMSCVDAAGIRSARGHTLRTVPVAYAQQMMLLNAPVELGEIGNTLPAKGTLRGK